MSERATTQWVPIEQLIPHPENANSMTDETREKLARNIDETGKYPPIIVRTLDASIDFAEAFSEDKLQIIDGEHRWKYLKERGATEVHVDVWPSIGDERAKLLLLTLNRLVGKDDAKKRNTLIRELIEEEIDPEALSLMLPETQDQIVRMVEESSREEVQDAIDRAANVDQTQPITFFVTSSQAEVIRSTIKEWLDINDPNGDITECREGEALMSICENAATATNA